MQGPAPLESTQSRAKESDVNLGPMLVPIIPLSCFFSLVSRARVFPNPHLALGSPGEEADPKAFVS